MRKCAMAHIENNCKNYVVPLCRTKKPTVARTNAPWTLYVRNEHLDQQLFTRTVSLSKDMTLQGATFILNACSQLALPGHAQEQRDILQTLACSMLEERTHDIEFRVEYGPSERSRALHVALLLQSAARLQQRHTGFFRRLMNRAADVFQQSKNPHSIIVTLDSLRSRAEEAQESSQNRTLKVELHNLGSAKVVYPTLSDLR
eukprot:gene13966-569_t